MQGSWNHGQAYYRCKFPTEYAVATHQHPRTVYVREAAIVPALDRWLATLFDSTHIDSTCALLAAASGLEDVTTAQRQAARRRLPDCDARLARYRAALEAGTDAVVVAGWVAEVSTERSTAERALREAATHKKLTKTQVKALVEELGDIPLILAKAGAQDKAALYNELGLNLTYHVDGRVTVEAQPCTPERVGGGT